MWHHMMSFWCHMTSHMTFAMLIQNSMRHWTKSYDITCDIWMVPQSHMRHWTKSYDITCDIYTGLACVTANVLYIHDICFIQSISKPAWLHITGITPGMSCHVTAKWHHMTSQATFGCRPKIMMSGMVWRCDVIWHQHDITWCHIRLLGSRLRHE